MLIEGSNTSHAGRLFPYSWLLGERTYDDDDDDDDGDLSFFPY